MFYLIMKYSIMSLLDGNTVFSSVNDRSKKGIAYLYNNLHNFFLKLQADLPKSFNDWISKWYGF